VWPYNTINYAGRPEKKYKTPFKRINSAINLSSVRLPSGITTVSFRAGIVVETWREFDGSCGAMTPLSRGVCANIRQRQVLIDIRFLNISRIEVRCWQYSAQ